VGWGKINEKRDYHALVLTRRKECKKVFESRKWWNYLQCIDAQYMLDSKQTRQENRNSPNQSVEIFVFLLQIYCAEIV
jgi:hypothetical protein